jgi:hypothetical protein
MSPDQAASNIHSAVEVTREDIARAKTWITQAAIARTPEMADAWLRAQGIDVPRSVETDSPSCPDLLRTIARAYSLHLAFYQAVCELVAAGEMIPADAPTKWEASLEYRTQHGAGPIPLKHIRCYFPQAIDRPPLTSAVPADTDIFLKGIDCATIHPGILEAVEQALGCFRRGLYMPATAMLAAAAEATWTECGAAVAIKLANPKLEAVIKDQYSSISRKVTDVRKALEHANAKTLLQQAKQTIAKVHDAEIWTTTLRDRRNALHWGRAKSFIADHSGTAALLIAGPLHLGTLEAIRGAC